MASVKLEICIFPLYRILSNCPNKMAVLYKTVHFFSFQMKKVVVDQKMDKWQSVNQAILMQHNVNVNVV